MSDSLGQGFTASIVNSAANYVSADHSTLGMADGITGAIQYVKLVWGGSGEAKFVSETGTDPSALPVSLNNADNYWLINSVLDTVHRTSAGNTAFRVAIDGAGLCFAGACFGNIQLGSSVTISGFSSGATNANFGVTFGTVGITAPNGLRVRNYLSGAGVVEPLQVTGGIYGLGGTFAISNALSVDLSAGVTIVGVRSGFTMPVSIAAGGLSLGSDQIVTRISSIAAGVTVGVALTTPGGTFFPGAYQGIPVFGVTGQTPVGMTMSGVIGITQSGLLGVTFTGAFTTDLSAGVTINGFKSGALVGATISGPVEILSNSSIGITTVGNLGVTFGKIAFDTSNGMGVSLSGVGISGNSLKVSIDGVGVCLGNVTLNATQFGVYGLSGGTAVAVAGRQGSTFGIVAVNPSDGKPYAGSDKGIPVFGVSGATAIGTTFGSVTIAGSVKVSNSASADSIPVQIKTWQSLDGSSNLIDHLKGLTVSISGFTSSTSIGATLGLFGGSTYLGVFTPSTGITIASLPNVVLDSTSIAAVKGQAESLTTSPVGVSMTGRLQGLSGFGSGGALIGITIPGVGICGSQNALNVAVVGAGLCLGSVSISATQFSVYGLSGGTAVNISQKAGDTLGVALTDISGKVLGHSGTAFIGFPIFGVSGATAVGVTIAGSVGITFGATTLFKVHPVKSDGSAFPDAADGFPVHGVTGATPIGVTGTVTIQGGTLAVSGGTLAVSGGTLNIGNTVGITGTISIRPSAYGASAGSTFAVVFADTFGTPLGLSGTSVVGIPVFGVSGATALGVTFPGINATVAFPSSGITISSILGFTPGTNIGISGGTLNFLSGTMAGGTLNYINLIGGICGGTLNNVFIRPFAYGATAGSTLGVVFTHPTTGIPFGVSLGGVTQYGIPVFGISGAPSLGITGAVTLSGPISIVGTVNVTGDSSTAIGVTLNGGGFVAVNNEVAVKTAFGTTLAVQIWGGTAAIRPAAYGNNFGSTLAVVLTNGVGTPLGMSGTTVIGIPVVGISGATAIGVTLAGGISLSGNVGVTFSGITFQTVRAILTGSAFTDGGNSLGIPVYGVAGATSVKVEVVGGTVAGIFVTDAPGITIMGVSSGIPVFGVSGATAIGVTFGAINSTITFPTSGITIAGISSGVTIGVTGTVAISGNLSIGTMPTTTVNYTTSAPIDVPVKAGSDMSNKGKLLAGTADNGIVVTPKGGNQFMWGMTLGLFLGVTGNVVNVPAGSDIIGASGATVWYLKPNPLPATMLYAGQGRDGLNIEGNTAVPLKQGLHIQLSKWDAISHVLIGYTAPSQFEFLKNAQVLTKEYQIGPIWAHAMDQFRRYPGGLTANSILASANPATNTAQDAFGRDEQSGVGNAAHIEPKQYMGVIEKPSRIFVPTNDAGLVYILPKGDYQNHIIGSGFWNEETGEWTPYTLYERSHYAGEVHGFSGGEPDLTTNGAGNTVAQYGEGQPAGRSITTTGVSFGFNQSQAMIKILASHAAPFIRIWGY